MKRAIIVDIDGTIADLSDRLHHIQGEKKDWDAFYDAAGKDTPIDIVIDLIQSYVTCEWGFCTDLLFVTGRPERIRDITEKWLEDEGFFDFEVFMRKDGDYRQDYIVKKEIYDKEIKGAYDVLCVFEDRDQTVKMWRELGLTCFQVTDGNF